MIAQGRRRIFYSSKSCTLILEVFLHTKLFTVLALTLVVAACSKKQQVIFEAQSISYIKKNTFAVSEIQKECNALSQELSKFMNDGWKVVASSPKERVVFNDLGTCVGTEYILEK